MKTRSLYWALLCSILFFVFHVDVDAISETDNPPTIAIDENYIFFNALKETGIAETIGSIQVDDEGNIYVPTYSWTDGKIKKLSANGVPISEWGTRGSSTGQFLDPSDVALDSEGNIYVADYNNHRIQKFNAEGIYQTSWGEEGTENGKFLYPTSIAVDISGYVYVVDTYRRIQKFDLKGEFIESWRGEFGILNSIAVDHEGNILIADNQNNVIHKLSSSGNLINKWGEEGNENGQFLGPRDIAVDNNDNIYVADSNNKRVQKFDSNGNYICKWENEVNIDRNLSCPIGISVGQDGGIYVVDVDGDNYTIKRLIPGNAIKEDKDTGEILFRIFDDETPINDLIINIESSNTGLVPLNNIILGGDGSDRTIKIVPLADKYGEATISIIVSDGINSTTSSFDILVKEVNDAPVVMDATISTDNQTKVNSTLKAEDVDGDPLVFSIVKQPSKGTVVITNSSTGTYKYTPNETGEDSFSFKVNDGYTDSNVATVLINITQKNDSPIISIDVPYYLIKKWEGKNFEDIDIDDNGYLYGSYFENYENRQIYKYDLADDSGQSFGNENISYPSGILADKEGNVYVADMDNHNIQKYDNNGNLISTIGEFGYEEGQFNDPSGVAIDSQGNIYVTDLYNYRIQKFNKEGQFIRAWGGFGEKDGEFDCPYAIVIDDVDDVYVSDLLNHNIQKFDSDGEFICKWGSEGSGAGQFNQPLGLAVDDLGYIYVSDWDNNTIQKFDSKGTLINIWGIEGESPGEIFHPEGITIDDEGFAYFCSKWSSVIKKLLIGKMINEDTDTGEISFTVSDLETSAEALTVTAASTNTELVKNQNIILGGSGENRTIKVIPEENKYGATTIIITVSDGVKTTRNSFSVKVENIEDEPIAQGALVTIDEDTLHRGFLNAMDADDDDLTYEIIKQGDKGFVEIIDNSTGEYRYTPNTDEVGEDTFTFKVNDGKSDSNEATIKVQINSINDLPVSEDGYLNTDEEAVALGNLQAIDSDDNLTYRIVKHPGKGTVEIIDVSTGQYRYIPNTDETGEDNFTFVANDGKADSNEGTIQVTINNLNDLPIITDIYKSGDEDSSISFSPDDFTAQFQDVDGDSLTKIKLISNPTGGTLRLNGQALNTNDEILIQEIDKLEFITNENWYGRTSFQWNAYDGKAYGENTAKAVIEINGINDLPSIDFDEEYYLEKKWGNTGSEPGNFKGSFGITVDKDGNLYVADYDNNRIQIFDPQGNYMRNLRNEDCTETIKRPYDVAIDHEGNVYLIEGDTRYIKKFNQQGDFINKWGGYDPYGENDEKFGSVQGIAIDHEGNVYAADSMHCLIKKYDKDGHFLTKWGGEGTEDGKFKGISDVVVDSEGNIYASDKQNHRIQKFDPTGKFLKSFGKFGTYAEGELRYPQRLAVDKQDNVYVADLQNKRVQKFDSEGNYKYSFGGYLSNVGSFDSPSGVAVDGNGNVYVADGYNYIEKFVFGKIINENTSTGEVSITINDIETLEDELIIAKESSNESLIPHENIIISGNGTNRTVNFIPQINKSGTATIRITVDDHSDQVSRYFTVKVNAFNHNPIALGGEIEVNEDSSVNATLIANDSDEDLLTYFIIENPSKGTVEIINNNTGEYRYIPNKNEIGQDSFSYKVSDGNLDSNIATVNITILQVNQPPSIDLGIDLEFGFIKRWGNFGIEEGDLQYPRGMALDREGNIYVADSSNYRIQKFDGEGNYLLSFGSYGNGEGQFNYPNDVVVDDEGNIYVTEAVNNRIQKFDHEGNFIKEWGTFGEKNGQFDIPAGIAMDEGYVYVVDYLNNRVQKFDSEGNHLLSFGSKGDGEGQFNQPYDIEIDKDGNINVVDILNNRIQRFDSSGNFILSFGSKGYEDGQLFIPLWICIDGEENIYVADNNKVQKFDKDGSFIEKLGSYGYEDGQFAHPSDLVMDSYGNLFVTDFDRHDIQKFGYAVRVDEDGKIEEIPFTIHDEHTAGDSLIVSVDSSNKDLVPNENIIIIGNDENRSIKITPVENKYGNTMLTIFVNDGEKTAKQKLNIVINPVNDQPIISINQPSKNITLNENEVFVLSGFATDLEDDAVIVTGEINGVEKISKVDLLEGEIWSLVWDAKEIGEGEYSNITVTVEDGYGATASAVWDYALKIKEKPTVERESSNDKPQENFIDRGQEIIDGINNKSVKELSQAVNDFIDNGSLAINSIEDSSQSKAIVNKVIDVAKIAIKSDDITLNQAEKIIGSILSGSIGDMIKEDDQGSIKQDFLRVIDVAVSKAERIEENDMKVQTIQNQTRITIDNETLVQASQNISALTKRLTNKLKENGMEELSREIKKEIVIKVPDEANEKEKVNVQLASNALQNVNEEGVDLVIKTKEVILKIPPNLIDLSDENVELEISKNKVGEEQKRELKQKHEDLEDRQASLVMKNEPLDLDINMKGSSINAVQDFNEEISIEMPLENIDLTNVDVNKLGIYVYDEKNSKWEYVKTEIRNGKLICKAPHFSIYAVMEFNKEYKDIVNHWAKDDIEIMTARHIANYVYKGEFIQPYKFITRREFAALISKTLGKEKDKGKYQFKDIDENQLYSNDIALLADLSIVNGVGDGAFEPNKNITREQMAVMMTRLYKVMNGTELEGKETLFVDKESISSWAIDGVKCMYNHNIMIGFEDGTFKPQEYVTRAQAIVMLKRILEI